MFLLLLEKFWDLNWKKKTKRKICRVLSHNNLLILFNVIKKTNFLIFVKCCSTCLTNQNWVLVDLLGMLQNYENLDPLSLKHLTQFFLLMKLSFRLSNRFELSLSSHFFVSLLIRQKVRLLDDVRLVNQLTVFFSLRKIVFSSWLSLFELIWVRFQL